MQQNLTTGSLPQGFSIEALLSLAQNGAPGQQLSTPAHSVGGGGFQQQLQNQVGHPSTSLQQQPSGVDQLHAFASLMQQQHALAAQSQVQQQQHQQTQQYTPQQPNISHLQALFSSALQQQNPGGGGTSPLTQLINQQQHSVPQQSTHGGNNGGLSIEQVVSLIQNQQLQQQQQAALQAQNAPLLQLLGGLISQQSTGGLNILQILALQQLLASKEGPKDTLRMSQEALTSESLYTKFFVGGILYSAREYDVENYFNQIGNVVDVAIMRDKHTGKSRGFAFVTFKARTQAEIDKITQLMTNPSKPHYIQGRSVEIRASDGSKPADSFLENKRDSGSSSGRGTQISKYEPPIEQHRDNNGGRSYSSNSQSMQNRMDEERKKREIERLKNQGVKRDRIFVGGLDYSLREGDLRHHFEQFGEVRDVEIVRDPNSKASRGFGFVTFRDDKVASRLITEIQITQIGNRMVDIRTADPKGPQQQNSKQDDQRNRDRQRSRSRAQSQAKDRRRDRKRRDRRRKRSKKQKNGQSSQNQENEDDESGSPSDHFESSREHSQETKRNHFSGKSTPKLGGNQSIKQSEDEEDQTAATAQNDSEQNRQQEQQRSSSPTPHKQSSTKSDKKSGKVIDDEIPEGETLTLTESSTQQQSEKKEDAVAINDDSWRQNA
ncbi:hypothetical protein FGO68_gene16240 [Halteria grandinella]|uniref:RRM domain-containing protein n=1 Tax=Halteria grandinella TaxID=5974 RepID=A0A8J8T4N9_HALGN|nr:hypothetical protein FGO68_gene16240 [Halteria grandinella]